MAKGRKVSSISKEFDGKEVQGKLIERSGLLGSKISKEVFKMPGGGKHIEKTRTNRKGDVVSRLSRDTKVNPLKVFNDNKEKAYKKAGGEMSTYKKSLRKAQTGQEFKESVLAKEWANSPVAGAEPEWSYLEGLKNNTRGPVASGYRPSPYQLKRTITDSKGNKTTYDNSSAINDPRFSAGMEKTNEFYNKEKNAGTLFTKGFSDRMKQNKPAKGTINTLKNDSYKKGGSIKRKRK